MFYQNDYLISESEYPARYEINDNEIILTNGLAERRFLLHPYFACVGFKNLYSSEQFLRSIKPEATVTINGKKYSVGGVSGQFERGFMKPVWYDNFTQNGDFRYCKHRLTSIKRNFHWVQTRQASAKSWPPKGICLEVTFSSEKPELKGIEIIIRYECYDNLPAFGKTVAIVNNSGDDIRLDEFEVEILAITEHESATVLNRMIDNTRNLFCSSDHENALMHTFSYLPDQEYTSQVDYLYQYPLLLVSKPPLGPYKKIENGGTFVSYTAYILLFDEDNSDRRMLQVSRFYKLLTPWVTENPIYIHVASDDRETLITCIDQCVETGFEMVLISFGSGLNMEDVSQENIAKYKEIADYAHSRGIEIGGYSLLASRSIDEQNDIVSESPIFDQSPCLGSEWGAQYLRNIRTFLSETGFDILEHDGSYPGDVCHSEKHPGHEEYRDSQYTQMTAIADLYAWCRNKGIYLNVPERFFFLGVNKSGMGYREVNWSLPREQQAILARQNIHDGTYDRLPSMGWMFVPLVEYHGGGEAATIEPLCEHLDHYRLMLNNNLLAGVQAAYRGKRIYDTEETKMMVRDSISVYKKYRAILESPAVKLRRPDGRDYDGYIHVNPELEEKGMLVLFNPLDEPIHRTVRIPLYYTGITEMAKVALFDNEPISLPLERDYSITLNVTIPANDFIWYVIR